MYLALLTMCRESCKGLPRELTLLVSQGAEGPGAKLGGDVIVQLLSVTPSLLGLPELDQLFVKLMDAGRHAFSESVDFFVSCVCLPLLFACAGGFLFCETWVYR